MPDPNFDNVLTVGRMMRSSMWVATLIPALAGNVVSAAAPYPPSTVITDVQWGTIINLGTDNDNWPCTWADDNNLYAAGGDGNGFGGSRRSSWICRITGHPENNDMAGTNISNLGTGDGSSGKKASGMLMVAGVLYMWVRNANLNGEHCQVMKSTNRGQSWTNGFTFTEFGYLNFINFGKNYAGARDNYVYSVSHDNPSAYAASKDMVLMRAPKGSIMTKSAYEFFAGLDGNGNPQWSSNVSARQPVFTNQDGGSPRCARSGISYNAALGRYLWWQQYYNGTVDTRGSGGFGIYDAPEPWGPWTTVYFTTNWDVGPGDGASFPAKYMSADGKTCWLVYSGNDSFRLRKATFTAGPVDTTPPSIPTGLTATPVP